VILQTATTLTVIFNDDIQLNIQHPPNILDVMRGYRAFYDDGVRRMSVGHETKRLYHRRTPRV